MANRKITVQDLAECMAVRHSYSKTKSENFIRCALSIIKESLEKDSYVKVKGLGTFKLVTVNSRESVNVNTGERIEISEHQRLTFTPDKSLKSRVNRPFEHFATVVIEDDNIDLNTLSVVPDVEVVSTDEEEKVPVEAPMHAFQASEKPEVPVQEIPEPVSEDIEQTPDFQEVSTDAVSGVSDEQEGDGDDSNRSCRWHGLIWGLLTLMLMLLSYLAGSNGWLTGGCQSTPEEPTLVSKPDTFAVDSVKTDSVSPKLQETAETKPDESEESPEVLSQRYDQLPGGRFLIIGTLAEHEVQPGESLTRISKKYFYSNAEDYVPYIIFYNKLSSADVVHKGTVLKVPKLAHRH